MRNRLFIRGALLLLAAAATATAMADDAVPVMLVHTQSGTGPLQVEVSGKTRITFAGNTMQISQASGESKLDIGDVNYMEFDMRTSSDENLCAPLTDDITLAVAGKTVKATSASGAEVEIRVYNMAGIATAGIRAKGEAEIDFSKLQSGVYIIVCGNKNIKYSNK